MRKRASQICQPLVQPINDPSSLSNTFYNKCCSTPATPNVICDSTGTNCLIKLGSHCVNYTGVDIPTLGIFKGQDLSVVIEKLSTGSGITTIYHENTSTIEILGTGAQTNPLKANFIGSFPPDTNIYNTSGNIPSSTLRTVSGTYGSGLSFNWEDQAGNPSMYQIQVGSGGGGGNVSMKSPAGTMLLTVSDFRLIAPNTSTYMRVFNTNFDYVFTGTSPIVSIKSDGLYLPFTPNLSSLATDATGKIVSGGSPSVPTLQNVTTQGNVTDRGIYVTGSNGIIAGVDGFFIGNFPGTTTLTTFNNSLQIHSIALKDSETTFAFGITNPATVRFQLLDPDTATIDNPNQIVGRFNGRVEVDDAINDDEAVTKRQLDNIVIPNAILNQLSSQQTANFWISGIGRFGNSNLETRNLQGLDVLTLSNTITNSASRLYIIPNGTIVSGAKSSIKLFGTDFLADQINYDDFNITNHDTEVWLNHKKNGTSLNKDIILMRNDTEKVLHIKTGGTKNVLIGSAPNDDAKLVLRGNVSEVSDPTDPLVRLYSGTNNIKLELRNDGLLSLPGTPASSIAATKIMILDGTTVKTRTSTQLVSDLTTDINNIEKDPIWTSSSNEQIISTGGVIDNLTLTSNLIRFTGTSVTLIGITVPTTRAKTLVLINDTPGDLNIQHLNSATPANSIFVLGNGLTTGNNVPLSIGCAVRLDYSKNQWRVTQWFGDGYEPNLRGTGTRVVEVFPNGKTNAVESFEMKIFRPDITTLQADSDLNILYPDAEKGVEVYCKNIVDGGIIYIKDDDSLNTWVRVPLLN